MWFIVMEFDMIHLVYNGMLNSWNCLFWNFL